MEQTTDHGNHLMGHVLLITWGMLVAAVMSAATAATGVVVVAAADADSAQGWILTASGVSALIGLWYRAWHDNSISEARITDKEARINELREELDEWRTLADALRIDLAQAKLDHSIAQAHLEERGG